MFNSLASLAERHGKRTVILAAIFFVIAGGGSAAPSPSISTRTGRTTPPRRA